MLIDAMRCNTIQEALDKEPYVGLKMQMSRSQPSETPANMPLMQSSQVFDANVDLLRRRYHLESLLPAYCVISQSHDWRRRQRPSQHGQRQNLLST